MSTLWPNGGTTPPTFYREASGGFRWTSPFGMRTHPVTGRPSTFHYGLDLIGWSTIVAPSHGTITFAGYNGGAGNEVRMRADGPDAFTRGDVYRMLHNRVLHVRTGQRVTQGQALAEMGTTGSSTGVHCHLETRPGGGAAVNPLDYYARVNRGGAPAGGVTPKPKDIRVKTYRASDARAKAGKISLGPGSGIYLHNDPKAGTANASNVVGSPGPYSLTPHVYAEGEPGDVLLLRLIWQTDPGTSKARNSPHYEERLVIDRDGKIRASREFKRAVSGSPSPTAVYVRVDAVESNKKPVKVTVLDCDSYLFSVA